MILLFLLIASVTLLVIYVNWALRRRKYWDEVGVPHLKGPPFLGQVWKIGDTQKPWFVELPKYTKKYGKFWGYDDGVDRVLVTSDLDAVKEILHTRFDEFSARKGNPLFQAEPDDPQAHLVETSGARWKRLRALVSPQFSIAALKKILPTVRDSAEHLVGHIGKAENSQIDIHTYFQEYTVDIIARIAMGQVGSQQFNSEYAQFLRDSFARDPREPFFLTACAMPFLRKYLRATFIFIARTFNIAAAVILKKIEAAVKQRKMQRANGEQTTSEKEITDFIDLFLDAEADVDLKAEEHMNYKDVAVNRHLVEDEIVQQCFLFLLAGFDTTANSLSYCTYYLVKHPEVQKRLQDEIESVCGNEKIMYEHINDLKYMDYVVKEALRLNPLGTVVVCRQAENDCTLHGIPLKKGDYVQADAYTIQKSKEIWGPDAEEFNPERWISPTATQKDAYLSFGGGPRQCVGMRLAYLEEKMALAHVLRKYTLVQDTKTENELSLTGWITVSPRSVTVGVRRKE